MAQEATGTTWNGAGLNDRSPEFLRRGKAMAVAVRDARGAATNISPHNPDGSIFWSPFTQDLKIRGDLFATKKVAGYRVTNTDPNQGFWNMGAFKEGNGPSTKPSMKNDRFRIEQSNFAYDTDLVEEDEPFSFTPVDTADPAIQRITNMLRLNDDDGNSLVEDPGTLNFGVSRLLSGHNPGRQVLIFRERRWNGLPIISCDGFALALADDKGGKKVDKKDSEAQELTFLPTPDGFFMAVQDGEYQPILVHTWWGGTGWQALGGLPVFANTVPTPTALGSGGVSLALPVPTGTGDPWTYDGLQSSTDDGVTWSTLAPATDVDVVGSTVTITVAGIATGSKKFRAKATGSNGASAYSPKSTAVTVT